MARITHSHLGTPSGKLGNVIYKRRNKKHLHKWLPKPTKKHRPKM